MNLAHTLICATLTHPLRTGSAAAGKCHYCETLLQATSLGQAKIREGGWTVVCNRCGFAIFNAAAAAGCDIQAEIGPQAELELRRQSKLRHEDN